MAAAATGVARRRRCVGWYDSVHRFARAWRQERARLPAKAYCAYELCAGRARVALHWFITLMIAKGDEVRLGHIHREIVRRPVELGFHAKGADQRVCDLVDRSEDGWTFQAKQHLRVAPELDGGF